jgi:uncharacterized small protein (DUF1192 family)
VEDEDFKKTDVVFTPMILDRWSVDSLQEYLSTLQNEINRVNQEIATKRSLQIKADSFFRKSEPK